MSWYGFRGYNNNKAVSVSAFDGAELTALGFHGYPTEAEAERNLNSVPGFPNPLALIAIPAVNAAIDDANNARDVGSAPGNLAKKVGSSALQTAKDIPGVGTVDDLINVFKKSWSNILIQIGEVTVGVILLYIGLKAMASPAGQQVGARTVKNTAKSVTGVARKVVKR